MVVMEMENENKDLILREQLSIERTVMANQRTFLSFLRTALYFLVGGLSIGQVLQVKNETIYSFIFFIIAFALLLVGVYNFFRQKRNIAKSRRHVGNYKNDYQQA